MTTATAMTADTYTALCLVFGREADLHAQAPEIERRLRRDARRLSDPTTDPQTRARLLRREVA